MGKHDHNNTTVDIPPGSCVSSCSYNSGDIKVGGNSELTKCSYNSGNVNIGDSSKIDTISYNSANIDVGNNSRISTIKYNSGNIRLGKNCKVDNLRYNSGIIIADLGSSIPKGKYNSGTVTVLDTRSPERRQSIPPVLKFEEMNFQPDVSIAVCHSHSQFVPDSFTPSAPPVFKKRKAPEPPIVKGKDSESDDPEKGVCSICMENPRNVAFHCGHLCCENCAESLTQCHFCRENITQKIKLFL